MNRDIIKKKTWIVEDDFFNVINEFEVRKSVNANVLFINLFITS